MQQSPSRHNSHAALHQKLNQAYKKGLQMLKDGKSLREAIIWLRAEYESIYQRHEMPDYLK